MGCFMKRLLVSFYPGDEKAKDIVVIQDFKDSGVFKVINAFEGDEAKKIIDMLTDKKGI